MIYPSRTPIATKAKEFDDSADTHPDGSMLENLEVRDHANQQHFDGNTCGSRQSNRRCDEFAKIHVCHERRRRRCAGNCGRVTSRRQIDDRVPLGRIQHIGAVEARVGAVRSAASVGGCRGKHRDLDPGEFDLFDQRWRQELLGEYFPGQWNVHAVGFKSAGCQRQRVESERG